MKLFICVCFLVVSMGPCAKAKSFHFDNFFLGSSKKDLASESTIPRAASQMNLLDSNPFDYSTEVDSETFNSSSDDVFDFENQNSSSDSLEVIDRKESDNVPAISGSQTTPAEAIAEVPNNETHSSDKAETTTASVSSTVTGENATTLTEGSSTTNVSKESSNTVDGEQEEVVLETTTGGTAVLIPKTFFQKSIDWVEDAYTLSILIPITAGILFATTIIVVVAFCRCLRRCCRRRRFKRKPLPDSVKSLRPSDRARLLGDTSDEEF